MKIIGTPVTKYSYKINECCCEDLGHAIFNDEEIFFNGEDDFGPVGLYLFYREKYDEDDTPIKYCPFCGVCIEMETQ